MTEEERLRRIRAEQRFTVYCECRDEACAAEIELTLDEWDRIQSQEGYAIVPGHPIAADELVVEQNERFALVNVRA